MDDNLANRLRRLGVFKGARHLRPAAAPPPRERPFDAPVVSDGDVPPPLHLLFPGGYLAETPTGACFVVDNVYPRHYRHGGHALEELLQQHPGLITPYMRDDRLRELNFRDFVFLDTETTGLSGAGTLAFMVGVAFFEPGPQQDELGNGDNDVFVVRQYFLRDHDDEAAMLLQLDELLASRAGLVSFNGRSFDVPLLDTRYLMNRLPGRLMDLPHIDLLPLSRRLFRARLGSCALGALEQNLLSLHRTQEDVPGWLIPSLYHTYLRTRDARDLTRVFYHNLMDMLSMVSLATRVVGHFRQESEGESLDLLSLGRWQADLGLTDEAEATLRRALAGDLSLEAYHQALHQLGMIYKQADRREEAMVVWQQIAFTSTDEVTAHVELAKHFEWQVGDPSSALNWTEQALDLVARWPHTVKTHYTQSELAHRRERLLRKIG